jgi:hypothetical protein
LIASNVFFASSCVDLTCPYQTDPPALQWSRVKGYLAFVRVAVEAAVGEAP